MTALRPVLQTSLDPSGASRERNLGAAALAVARAIADGSSYASVPDGLVGRLLRGRGEDAFSTLTADPGRRFVFLTGPDGLESLAGHRGTDLLQELGYSEKDIDKVVSEGNEFRIAVFPEQAEVRPATWASVIDVVGLEYPELRARLNEHLPALQSTPFSEIEQQYGVRFSDINKLGSNDPRFMTADRYAQRPNTLANARAFLYFTVQCRELFTGDGYTRTPDGQRGVSEFIAPNVALDELGAAVVPVPMSPPTKTARSLNPPPSTFATASQ